MKVPIHPELELYNYPPAKLCVSSGAGGNCSAWLTLGGCLSRDRRVLLSAHKHIDSFIPDPMKELGAT